MHINQSLTTLGRVIMELVEAQKAGRVGQSAGHHIPYRDSRLTFLLQVRAQIGIAALGPGMVRGAPHH